MNRTNDQGPQWDSWDNEKDVPPRRGEPSGGVTHYEGVDMASVDEADAREALVEQIADEVANALHPAVLMEFQLAEVARAVWPAVAAQVEAAVSVVRAEADARLDAVRLTRDYFGEQATANGEQLATVEDQANRLAETLIEETGKRRAAEADLRALREGLEALADDWDKFTDADWFDHTPREHADVLRALLAPSPAEGAVRHDVD